MKKTNASSCTKERIFTAAISLFYDQGYDGTSVRDIAKKASVNPANISYYFKGKQGLLEMCFTQFFEQYLNYLELQVQQLEEKPADHCLKDAVKDILEFQRQNYHLSRFVWREVSRDSQLIREIISSYLMKERYYFKTIFEEGMNKGIFSKQPISFLVIQLKSMMTMPFLNSQQLREVWHVFPHEKYFTDFYMKNLEKWFLTLMLNQNNEPKHVQVL